MAALKCSLVAIALLALGGAAPALAQDRGGADAEARRHLDDGRTRYADLDFVGSIEALRRALAVPGVSEAVRLEAYEYLGASYVVLEQEDQAREAFLEMIAIDPYHVVREPSGSPKIARFVARIRSEAVPDAALDPRVRLRAALPRGGRTGEPTRVRLTVEGPQRIATVRLYVRGVGESGFTIIDAVRTSQGFTAEIEPRSSPDQLELYAEGRDARDRVVSRAGEPFAPLALEIVQGEIRGGGGGGGGLLSAWWFWAAVGAVVAGGIAVGVVVGSGGEGTPMGTLPPGIVNLP